MVVFIGHCAAERAELKDEPFAEFFGGPFQLAINDEDRPAGFEILLDETLVGLSEPKSLDRK
jgi:hypothetical protein